MAVLINNAIPLKFVVDTGAADVTIPADVVSTLLRTGTIDKSDFIGTRTYGLADGSSLPSLNFRLRSLKVGDALIENVVAALAPQDASLLLGQSFLTRFKSWSIDNTRQALILEPREGQAITQPPPVPEIPPQQAPFQAPPSAKPQKLYLACTPTVVANDEPDHVVSVSIGIWTVRQADVTNIVFFDAWHRTANGNIYKRSEQYSDRRLSVLQAGWSWDGWWIRDRNVYMIGQLALANGGYTYRERIIHGDPGKAQNAGTLVTDTVCKPASYEGAVGLMK